MNARFSPSRVVVHHTASPDRIGLDSEAIRRYHVFSRGWRDVGYHWLIESVEGVYVATMGRPMFQSGAHVAGENSTALGVAFLGDFTNAPPPVEQLDVGAKLIAGLFEQVPTLRSLMGHRDLRATECPGKRFGMHGLAALVDDYLGRPVDRSLIGGSG